MLKMHWLFVLKAAASSGGSFVYLKVGEMLQGIAYHFISEAGCIITVC